MRGKIDRKGLSRMCKVFRRILTEGKLEDDIDSHSQRYDRGHEADTVERSLAGLEENLGNLQGYPEFAQVVQQMRQLMDQASQIFDQQFRQDQQYHWQHRRQHGMQYHPGGIPDHDAHHDASPEAFPVSDDF